MEQSWHRFIHDSAPFDHGVQVYRDESELADTVADYLAAGFERGEPAVVVAVPEHSRLFAERLAGLGWDTHMLEETGFLVAADAEETLAAVMLDGKPVPKRFDRVIGDLLEQATRRSPHRHVRAFGEMVDLLCLRGEPDAARALEAEWHRLAAEQRSFSLLCGYRIDVFDLAAQVSTLPHVCEAHSHVSTARDTERLHRAVDTALEEALGVAGAGRVYSMIAREIRRSPVPAAQLALMWVSAEMPVVATRVLALARTRYLQAA